LEEKMIEVQSADWMTQIPHAVKTATDGETIKVRTRGMAELGEITRKRVCPDKHLMFEYVEENISDVLKSDSPNIKKIGAGTGVSIPVLICDGDDTEDPMRVKARR
jgi:hypothetical protein